MKQMVFDFYKKMLEEEAITQLTKAAIIEDCYDKKNYPRCLEDLTDGEMKTTFGENIFESYKEGGSCDKIESEHLVILREYKKDDKTISIKRMVLSNSRHYQREMIADIVGSCLAIPEELLRTYVFEKKSVKKISDVFKYTKVGVKLRLIKFYYDNVVAILERYSEAA